MDAIIAAEARGNFQAYEKIAKQAHIIVGASAKNGIKDLVYALAGYNPTTEEVIAAFKHYVQEEARKYEPEFPRNCTPMVSALRIAVPDRGKPWHFKYLTVNHIYTRSRRAAENPSAAKAHKAKGGDRKKKLFQFLNEIGARALSMHLGRVLEMAEISSNRYTYEEQSSEVWWSARIGIGGASAKRQFN